MATSKGLSKERSKKKLGYARVSTKGQDIKPQVQALREYGCDEIIIDHGYSGKRFNRKGLRKLLGMLKRGDELVVLRLDRLGRCNYNLARLRFKFVDGGIRFVSLTQDLDLSTSNGILMYGILSVIAENESNLTGDRTKDGLNVRRTKGVRLGRPPLLSEKDVAKAAIMLLGDRLTKTAVANEFDVSTRTLNRSLKSYSDGAA